MHPYFPFLIHSHFPKIEHICFPVTLEIFWEIVNGIGEILKVDCLELFEEIIRDSKKAEEVMRLFSPLFEKKQAV